MDRRSTGHSQYIYSRYAKQPIAAVPKRGRFFIVKICAVFLFILASVCTFNYVHADSAPTEIRSGGASFWPLCLSNQNSNATSSAVGVSHCGGSSSEYWTTTDTTIQHGTDCLSVENNGIHAGNKVVSDACSIDAPGQVWLRDQTGYQNPNSGLCLAVPSTGTQLIVASCNTSSDMQTWTLINSSKNTVVTSSCNNLPQGKKVACYAIKEWDNWQSKASNHTALLNVYSDGNGYESWCADFVSYVYKEAGYPFTNGERDDWNEYEADNIQYMGFTVHNVGDYTPQPGDIAYFDYPGGHVEIVVSGGATPTYVYGDSSITDPTTGNGDMEANTITSDGNLGQIMYYLSPN